MQKNKRSQLLRTKLLVIRVAFLFIMLAVVLVAVDSANASAVIQKSDTVAVVHRL
jgi:hypothetical protein